MILPDEVPAMSLPGVVLLPKTVMPLRIFEDKYRQMLADSLGGHRLFAIANKMQENELSFPGETLKLHEVATVGLIRMSSQNPDGTSILMLEGTERVHIDQVNEDLPYPLLTVSPLPTTNRPEDELEAELVVDLLGKIDTLHELFGPSNDETAHACHAIDDLEMLCHFIMQTYCTSSPMLQKTLETTDLVKRCRIVSEYLSLQIMLVTDTDQ
ncbi:LON peptidase substrate-binding domain-containing protein [Pelagicoccus mobilis]|uniref:LON peptidase substrate-binding domain-containing protein n=1 Tax=Pelagicoccus mobilis TaxID=415221 RepID=A0A934VQX0_9BACT|nr:LON peptidase substrate-binding domain-containing protein [Pelagicoccus mobilis]MBK1877013.1 LON peptidase substrate-binding domain-containing protein [Pelagicoccus mobilis]